MAFHTSWRRLSGPNAQRASAFGRHGDAKGPRSSDAHPRRERVGVAPEPRGREEGRRFAPQKTPGRGGPAQQWSGSQRDATQKEQDRNSPAELLLPADPGTRWRLFQVAVPMRLDPGKDALEVHEALREAVARRLGCRLTLPLTAIRLVRKSFDS
ncbi:FAD dependent oxidoreductase, partial [Haematococcus lacustris]